MNFYQTDSESILSEIKHQEKQIKLKRRWLVGRRASEYEWKKFKKLKFLKKGLLPESVLREDDIFYESVKAYIERDSGAIETENPVVQDDVQSIEVSGINSIISSCLDNLTTKGLYLLAMILTGGSVKFEKTRCKMKKIIKSYLSSVLGRKNLDHNQLENFKSIFHVLSSSQNSLNCRTSTSRSESRHATVLKVLDGLQDFPYQTLIAMRRKLKGVGSVPQLQPMRQGWSKDHLVRQVRKISEEMLSQLDEGDELQEPLSKAMAIADLSRKLTIGCHDLFSEEFYQDSLEIKSLQKDIMEAVWLVKTAVKIPVLKSLHLLIEPDAQIPNGSLRTAFVKLLTEFLFECSDMDSVPKSHLSKILDAINRSSSGTHHGFFQRENFEQEVDCILNVSAQTKQIILDLLPDVEFDQDFMEALEESDEDNNDEDDDNSQLLEDRLFKDGLSDPTDSNHGVESIGEFVPSEFHRLMSTPERNSSFNPFGPGGNSNGDSVRQPPKKKALNLDGDQYQREI